MKKVHILGLIAIGIGVAAILATFSSASTYVSFSKAAQNPGQEYHVVGTLDSTYALEYNPVMDPNYFAFYLRDEEGNTQKVVHYGPMPADFLQSQKVVVIGAMHTQEFKASSILLKCPSKYQGEQEFKTASR